MFRRKVVRSFKVVEKAENSDFNILPKINSITLIGPLDNKEVVVTGTKKGIKNFLKQHQKLIEV